tara:strand:+ start:370 stop:684 length:315 start_codon:yes stop_codon:yes gene_type:complete
MPKMKPITKTRQLINYLYNTGNAISAAEITSRFGIKVPKREIAKIKTRVERNGNWLVEESVSNGTTYYQMIDTHPGNRMFQFDRYGKRFRPTENNTSKRLTTVG